LLWASRLTRGRMLGRFEMLPSLRQRVERSRDNDFTTLVSDKVALSN